METMMTTTLEIPYRPYIEPTPIERGQIVRDALRLALQSDLEDLSGLRALRALSEDQQNAFTVFIDDEERQIPSQIITPGQIAVQHASLVQRPGIYINGSVLSPRARAQRLELHPKPRRALLAPRLHIRLDNLHCVQPIPREFTKWDTM
jgi:hypothetical protein